ncbi:MAG: hypothetical protein QXP99_05955, partial [Thermoproteota archaeon]
MINQSEAQRIFISKARELADRLSFLDWDDVLVVFHADADGTAAAAIACTALRSMGISFCAKSIKQVDKTTLENIALSSKPVMFLDIGSGYLNEIRSMLDPSKVVILDHHEPEGDRNSILMLNPNEY